jgi:hypothetical protein
MSGVNPVARRVTRADRALTEMQQQLDWLRSTRSPSGHQWHETDLAREVGFIEAMDILGRHGARLVPSRDDVTAGGTS